MYISNVNSASIKLQHIEESMIAADEQKIFQTEEELEIICILKGAGTCVHRDYSHEIKKRDILIINPNEKIRIEPLRKMEFVDIKLTGVVFTSSSDTKSQNQLFVITDNTNALKHYLDLALLENAERFRGSDIVLRKILECIMVHLLRNNGLSIKDSATQLKHNEIERVKDYIRQNFSKKVTLEELSDLVDINKYYLIRLFKQQTGLSPIDYLIHVRLEESEKLLAQTNITVSDISDRVGFHSPSHFSKTFKESNHCTPSAYRKKYSIHI